MLFQDDETIHNIRSFHGSVRTRTHLSMPVTVNVLPWMSD